MDLPDNHWNVLEPLIGGLSRRPDGRGRAWRSSREFLNGVRWMLRTGAQWADLPQRYPPYQTCHRHFQRCVRDGTLERVSETLAQVCNACGKVDLSECFIDSTFVVAKKGERCVGTTTRGSGTKLMGVAGHWQTVLVFRSPRVPPRRRRMRCGSSLPLATLDSGFIDELPLRLIGDRAHAADALDTGLAALGSALIAPHRRNRMRPKTQDGHPCADPAPMESRAPLRLAGQLPAACRRL